MYHISQASAAIKVSFGQNVSAGFEELTTALLTLESQPEHVAMYKYLDDTEQSSSNAGKKDHINASRTWNFTFPLNMRTTASNARKSPNEWFCSL